MTAHTDAARKIEAKALRDAAADFEKFQREIAKRERRLAPWVEATEWMLARADELDSEVAR